MKGLRVEIVVRREGAPVGRSHCAARRRCCDSVGTSRARIRRSPYPSRGPLRRSWAILRPRFSWSGPDSPENVQNRPLTASGPSDGPAVRSPKHRPPPRPLAFTGPSPGTPDGSAWQGISCPLAHPSPPFKSPADGLQRICPRRARRPWSRRQLLRGLSRLDDAPAAPSTADHRDSPPASRPPPVSSCARSPAPTFAAGLEP